MADFGPKVRGNPDDDVAKARGPVLHAFGRLQRDSADHLDALFAAGCKDRRLPVLAAQIDSLLADPLTRSVLSPEEYDALVASGPILKERCAAVAAYDLPAALLHGDLHLGNVAFHDGEVLFFDWTDACISFPFLDLFEIYFAEEEDEQIRLRDIYLSAWEGVASPERLREVWDLARPLCGLHHAVSYATLVNALEPLVRDELLHGLPDALRWLLAAARM
jgi:Ser/Thr protein kinase RdoA (MazF antagonist)